MSKIDVIYDLVNKNSDKLDSMDDSLDEIKIEVAKNTIDLKEHMRRTDASEKRLEHIENRLTIAYLLKIISSSILTSGAIAGAIYQITKLTGL